MRYKKCFKKIFSILIIFIFFSLTVNLNVFANANNTENEEFNQNLNFSYNSILVVISKEKSLEFKNYIFSDFIESVNGEIIELTEYSTMIVKEKINNSKSYVNIDINIANFRRILLLKFLEAQTEDSVLEYVDSLRNNEEIDYVGPDYISYESAIEPNDFEYKEDNQWAIDSLELQEAWEFTKGTEDIVVGVIDTGIDGSHEDLDEPTNNNLHRDFSGYETITLEIPIDSQMHGTHVAGIIGAESNNEIGVSGTCWNITLVSLRINVDGLWYSSRVIRAVDYAIAAGIDVLNYSGRTRNEENNIVPYDDPALAQMIHLYPGLFICAAGNYNSNNDEKNMFPANYTLSHNNVISVGAYNKLNERCNFSNYGENTVSIFAPGEGIVSCIPGDNYDSLSGTSMATPYVTGVAALLLSLNKELTSAQLKQAILDGADEITITVPDTTVGANQNDVIYQNVLKLNAYNSVKYVLENYMNPVTYTLSNYSSTINTDKIISSNASYFDELNGFYKLNVTYAKNYEFILSSTSEIEVTLYDEDFTKISYNDLDSTSNIVHFIENLSTGTYYLRVSYTNEESTGTITTKIISRTTLYLTTHDNDILLNTHNYNEGIYQTNYYYFINRNGPSFYRFTLIGIKEDGTNVTYPSSAIIIKDNLNEEIIDKYSLAGYSSKAISGYDNNSLVACLDKNGYFYIHINIDTIGLKSLILSIEVVENETIDLFTLSESTNSEIKIFDNETTIGDYSKKITLNQSGKFKVECEYNGSQTNDILFVLSKINYNNQTDEYTINLLMILLLSDLNNSYTNTLNLSDGTYYITYFNKNDNSIIDVTFTRLVTLSDSSLLLTDPDCATDGGSQVEVYEKDLEYYDTSYRETYIVVGFTRVMYFDNIKYGEASRESFYWYSSDITVASVSQYGTVFGKKAGTVKIMAVNKNDSAIVFVKECTIINDPKTYNEVIYNEIYDTHKLSNGTYKVGLTVQNSPYPSAKYYTWKIVSKSETITSVSINEWGNVIVVGTGEIVIEGYDYEYNKNYGVRIYLTVIDE